MDYREFRDRYKYDSEKDLLGQGGFGRVFRAHDLLLDRMVALKIFSRDVPQQYDLISEIRRAIDLNHPNICRYYGAEVLRGTNALGEAQEIQVGVMELIPGGTVDVFLRKNPQHTKKLLADVLRGLSYLHQHQPPIIHRDLKPPNVLVGFEDGIPLAKVTDFGISKSASKSGAEMSKLGLGTYAYMAPEQINPARYGVNGKIQCNLDLWSFGAMTIEILTGVLPFGADNPEASTGQILEAIVHGIPQEELDEFEEPYRSVLARCMVQEAGKRAQSAAELIGLLEGEARLSPEPKRQAVVVDPVSRVDTVTEPPVLRAETEVATPEPAPRKSRRLLLSGIVVAALAVVACIAGYWYWVEANKQGQVQSQPQPQGVTDTDSGAADSTAKQPVQVSEEDSASTGQHPQVTNPRPAAPPEPVTPSAELTWTDPATGLMWAKRDDNDNINWQEAGDYCRNLQLDGHSGWRLPTIDELNGIYDPTANVVNKVYPNEVNHVKGNLQLWGYGWSSSRGSASGEAWYFDFTDGTRISAPIGYNSPLGALCVRRSGG